MKIGKVRNVLTADKETVLQCCSRLMLPQHFTAVLFPYVRKDPPAFSIKSAAICEISSERRTGSPGDCVCLPGEPTKKSMNCLGSNSLMPAWRLPCCVAVCLCFRTISELLFFNSFTDLTSLVRPLEKLCCRK